jgi:hypothetical protein
MNNFKTELFLEPKVEQYNSHQIMSNIYKTQKHKFINLDTKFSDDYNSYKNSNYITTLPEKINDVKSITMVNAEIPISFYNISVNLNNNVFTIINSITGLSSVITVPDGQYTASLLQSTINTLIQSSGSPYSNLTFDISGNFSSFVSSSSTLQILFDVGQSGSFDKYNFKGKLGWILGFRNITYTVSTTKIYSENFVDLNGSRYFYIVLDDYSKNGFTNNFIGFLPRSIINKNILAKITLNNIKFPFGSILTANTYNGLLLSDKRIYSGKTDIQKLNIQIVNELGNSVNLNGLDFSFAVDVEYE